MFVMGISHDSYRKECYECGHEASYPLPQIKKKIIYLDQFVIDHFVKVLDPKHQKHDKAKAEPFWLEAYKRLEVLVKAQLIVCPDSFYHRDESAPTGYFQSMQRIYEHFSNGATFYDHPLVTNDQIKKHFRLYLKDSSAAFPPVDPEEISIGELYEWQNKMKIAINMEPKDEETNRKQTNKQNTYDQFKAVFGRWQTEKNRKFDDWYREETQGFITGTIQVVQRHLKRQQELPEKFLKTGQVDIEDVLPPPAMDLIRDMHNITLQAGYNSQQGYDKMREYLQLPILEKVPAIRIGSLLYAAIADQAAKGRKEIPSPGVTVDVDMISAFLPYCDAMFVDKENAALLEDGRVKAKIEYPTKIFSLRNKEEFLRHLDELLANADPAHIELVKNVYGDSWTKPYTTILEHRN